MAGKVSTQLVIEGRNNTKQAFDQVNSQLESMNAKLAAAGKALAGAFSVSAVVGMVRSIAETADSYNLMNARLKLATGSQEEFNTVTADLKRIATETGTPLQSLATLYGRISGPLKQAGRSQREIIAVTEAVSKAFVVSGASAVEAENGVIQFAQALGSGALRGDEFNSVAEQAPRLMQALADGLNVPIGSLKEMAAQGELTADVVTDALIGQLDKLSAEAAAMPDTVGSAMTRLQDVINEAVGNADLTPLIEAINELGRTLGDPVVMQNLAALASALVQLAGTVVDGGSEFADLGKRIGFVAASAAGAVTELDAIDQQIADIDRSISGTGLSTTLAGLWYSEEELRAQRAALVAMRAMLVEQQTGISEETRKAAEAAQKAADDAREADLGAYRKYLGELKALQGDAVKASEGALKQQVSAEKAALRELDKIRADRLKIEERYQQALAGLQGGGEASYGAAEDLKVKARQALANQDVANAQAYAQQALAMIQKLAGAGESTYGFGGFIKELEGIELAANAIEQSQAEAKLESIRAGMESLKKQAKDLEKMPVSVQADDASIEAVRAAIAKLAGELGQQLVIPVSVANPLTAPQGEIPQYATGGYISGPGTGTSDSILARLSNGEFVMRAAAVKHYGPALLAAMNGLQLPKFADGGLVSSLQPASPASLGTLNFNLPGGESFGVTVTGDNWAELHKAALKYGRTTRR